jgi:hypothetical protein
MRDHRTNCVVQTAVSGKHNGGHNARQHIRGGKVLDRNTGWRYLLANPFQQGSLGLCNQQAKHMHESTSKHGAFKQATESNETIPESLESPSPEI